MNHPSTLEMRKLRRSAEGRHSVALQRRNVTRICRIVTAFHLKSFIHNNERGGRTEGAPCRTVSYFLSSNVRSDRFRDSSRYPVGRMVEGRKEGRKEEARRGMLPDLMQRKRKTSRQSLSLPVNFASKKWRQLLRIVRCCFGFPPLTTGTGRHRVRRLDAQQQE